MCSLNDLDGNCENVLLQQKPSFSEETSCRSCTNKGMVVLRKKDVYCRDCFLASATHKFRAALGKSKLMKPQDKVLVSYSGDQSSSALLHLLHSGVTEEQHKKLLYEVVVFFIDEGPILNINIDQRKKNFEKVKNEVNSYNFPLFACSLKESLKELPAVSCNLDINEDSENELIELFQNIKSFSSKEDLLYLLRQKLILKTAEQLNCNKVFTAEVGDDIAVKLLSSFSLGRGSTASFESSFCDSRHQVIKLLRPLRDFTRKEIIFYNKFQNVESLNIPSLTTKSSTNVSIQKLTEKFVTDLQEGFPSTVYTIFRTGEKLCSANKSNEKVNEEYCVLCKDKIRTNNVKGSYSAVEAADFSRNVSRKKLGNLENRGSCCGSCSDGCIKSEIKTSDIEKCVCYGCLLIVRDLKNINVLPRGTIEAAVRKKDLNAMKEEISEFLIENSSEVEV